MAKVKICGITNLEDAKEAVKLGAHAVGFVFAKSPRRISPEDASSIIAELPDSVFKVGLFVNATREAVNEVLEVCQLGVLQFHGDETPEFCECFNNKAKIIKAFRMQDEESLKALECFKVDGYLLDTYVEGKAGGTGKTFDWGLAKKAKEYTKAIILSGGLTPDNVKDAIKAVGPCAVDVSSGVEAHPGKKDFKLMRRFIENVKEAT